MGQEHVQPLPRLAVGRGRQALRRRRGRNALHPGRKNRLTLAEHVDERCAATPALADGSVFVRTKNYLWRLSDKR